MKHRRVERLVDTDSPDRIGPWATAEEAAHALETIQARQREYDREEDR